jgi:periplasmic protein TonB
MTARPATWFEPLWFGDETPRDYARWAGAGTLVVAVHAALLAGYLFWRAPEQPPGDNTEEISIELDPIDSTADAKLNVAPAPEAMIEQKATPPAPPKPVEPKKITPPPPQPDVTTADVPPPEVKPEKVEEPKPPVPMTAAPTKGGAPQVPRSWQTLVMRKLQRLKRYPGGARERGEVGVALATFSVDRDGHVLARKIVHSSGHADLDNEALAMIERAQPFPAFPPSMTRKEISLTVPVRFDLR